MVEQKGGGPETLGVDPVALAGYGHDLVAAANDIPSAPEPFVTAGLDDISQKIMDSQATIEGPILSGLPKIKGEATDTGHKVENAAQTYLRVDEELARAIRALVSGQLEQAASGAEGVDSGSGGGSGSPSAAGTPSAQQPAASSSTPSSGAPSAAASASSSGGDVSQMMSTPMQMAGQAAQIPSQAAGMVGALPQAAMQGLQQVSQLASGLGEGEGDPVEAGNGAGSDESGSRAVEPSHDEATAGPGAPGERAPVGHGETSQSGVTKNVKS